LSFENTRIYFDTVVA